MSHRSKQNGHPVPLMGIDFFDQEKTYPKEACDVHAHHSTLFSVSSNQNCRPDCFGRPLRSPDTDTARQALSTDLPLLWTKGHWGSQLDRAQGPGSELGRHTGLDQNSLSQSVLCALSTCQRRRFRAFSPVSAGNESNDRYIYQLCQVMAVTEVASHLNLDWKTVEAIDKHYLETQYGQPK